MQLFREGLTEALKLIVSGDPLVLDAAWRSLWISLLATGLAMMVGITLGSVLTRRKIVARGAIVLLFRAGMAVPTVLVGLIGYGLLSRRGFLGGLDLLYTPWAIVICEFFLALPIVVTWTHGVMSQLDPRLPETAGMLGAGLFRRWRTYLSECRYDLALAVLTAFARCFTELGVAMMVGGNIKFRTQTLATATALETARGEFARGVAMGLILLFMALGVTAVIAWISRRKDAA